MAHDAHVLDAVARVLTYHQPHVGIDPDGYPGRKELRCACQGDDDEALATWVPPRIGGAGLPWRQVHAAHTAAALADEGLLPSGAQRWGWATPDSSWQVGDPDDGFSGPMTGTHDVFTETDVRESVALHGGTAVVRTVFRAPEPTAWKDAS